MLNSIRTLKEGTRQLGAFLFQSATGLIGNQKYTAHVFWFFSRKHSLRPDLISGVKAPTLIGPVLVGDLHHSHRFNVATWIKTGLLFYVTAFSRTIGLGGKPSRLRTPRSILVRLVILFTSLNVKRYGELVVPISLVLGAITISSASKDIGFPALGLIATAVLGSAFLSAISRVKEANFGKPTY